MSTLVYCTGFEHGLATPTVNGGGICNDLAGTVAIQNSIKNTGSYAAQFTLYPAAAYMDKTITGTPTILVGRFYFHFESLPTSGTAQVFSARTALSASSPLFRYVQSSGAISASFNGSGEVIGPSITTTGWHYIDWRATVGPTTAGVIEWKVDGVAQTTVEFTITAGSFQLIRMGSGQTAVSTCELYLDDVAVSATSGDYPIGASTGAGLRPNADGTHSFSGTEMRDDANNTIDGANTAFSHLDESPWTSNATTDLVKQTANNTSAYCEVEFANTSYNNITGVEAVLQYAANSATATLAACYILYANDTLAKTIWGNNTTGNDYSETSCFYKSEVIPAPAGGWTTAEVNGLYARFGHGANAGTSNPYWLGLMLEVDGNGTAGGGTYADNYVQFRWTK